VRVSLPQNVHRKPLISVVLPVFNGEKYIAESIKSILAQTEKNFELILVEDGSKDQSFSISCQFTDPRIKIRRQENRGLAEALNTGCSMAKGEFIARQDQDDISKPQRLEKQISYMLAHPECGLLGTWAQILEGEKMVARFHRHPTDADELRYELLFNNPFVHSSVMIRKTILDKVGGYTTDPSQTTAGRLRALVANCPQLGSKEPAGCSRRISGNS